MLKKRIKSIVVALLVLTVLVGCDSKKGNGESLEGLDTIRIGVLVYDSTDSEVVAFKDYYTNYIAEKYPVEFIYSDSITTAEEEVAAIENFINLKAKGIISLSDQDRVASIKLANEAEVYFAVAAGTLTDEQFEELNSLEYYVGSIGPSLDIEEAVGYDMAKHYLDSGVKNFLLYAGGYPFVDMHKKRTEGMIKAFEEYGVTYIPRDNGMLGEFESNEIIVKTIDGFPDDSGAFFGTVAQEVSDKNLEVVLTAALGVEFFGASISQSNPQLKLATVASFTEAYTTAFNADPAQVDYLAGKYSSSVGPIFAAVFNAITSEENVMRENGNAFSLKQEYWVAIGTDNYNTMSNIANSTVRPAYSKDDLDRYISIINKTANYDEFKVFVENSKYEDVKEKFGE